jgi:cyclophilin family peptidyl-prolyl cis-trans isomerase
MTVSWPILRVFMESAVILVLLGFALPEKTLPAGPSEPRTPVLKPVQPLVTAYEKGIQAVIETSRGNIVFDLFPEIAPRTVARFSELAKKGFYNGLTFYRVLPKFLVQTGDPSEDGTGGSGQSLPAEFNERKHIAGTVGMARRHDPDSADSQFYICLEPQPFLDGKYTVFGQVIEGLELLSKIQERDPVLKLTLKP